MDIEDNDGPQYDATKSGLALINKNGDLIISHNLPPDLLEEHIAILKAARQVSYESYAQEVREQFAADLISRIEISVMTPGIATPSPVIELKEIYRLIDETLNSK